MTFLLLCIKDFLSSIFLQGDKKPFSEVINANIGNCHAMGQPYITFLRDVSKLTILWNFMTCELLTLRSLS